MNQRVDFSGNAPIYDRRHGAALNPDVARALVAQASLLPGARVLDIGAGTGRVYHPLIELGCQVVALEPALPMLHELRRKVDHGPVRLVGGEGARLPFVNGAFDAVVIARLLYLVADWKAMLNATRNVLAQGGCVLHEWGNGEAEEPWVRVREKARELFQGAGVEVPFHPGARTEREVDAYFTELGFTRSHRVSGGRGTPTTLREFLRRIVSGEMSYIWHVPVQVQQACLPRLQQWTEDTFDLEQPICVPNALSWQIYRA